MMEKKIDFDKCEDCGHMGKLSEEPMCGDYHYASSMCCAKSVCADGCRYRCNFCQKINIIELRDGYCEMFECYSCKKKTKINCTWSGMLVMDICERYCGCAISNWNGIITGRELNESIDA